MPLIIPDGVSEYFELTHFTKEERRIDIFLEERNVTPEEYAGNKLISKGFFKPITLQDFPMRGHEVFLHVSRRRWLNQDINKVVVNSKFTFINFSQKCFTT